MPQIANQDYNLIKSTYKTDSLDYFAYANLLSAILRGTIFDVIIQGPIIQGEESGLFRVISLTSVPGEYFINFASSDYGVERINFRADYTPDNYRVLGKIEMQLPDKSMDFLSDDTEENKYLTAKSDEFFYYVVVGGKCIEIGIDDEQIVSAQISDVNPPQGAKTVSLTVEDVPNIVGLGLY